MIETLRNSSVLTLCLMKEGIWDVPDEDDDTDMTGCVEYPFDVEAAEIIVEIPF